MWKLFPCLRFIHALHNSSIHSKEHPAASRKLHVDCESSRTVASCPCRQFFLMDLVSFAGKDVGELDLFVLCFCMYAVPFSYSLPSEIFTLKKTIPQCRGTSRTPFKLLVAIWRSTGIVHFNDFLSASFPRWYLEEHSAFWHSGACFTSGRLELMTLP